MKMTTGITVVPRIHRKVGKRLASVKQRPLSEELRLSLDPCENSSDSGLGFDHHLDYQLNARASLAYLEQENWLEDQPDLKRRRIDIKLESDDASDFSFSENIMRVKGPSESSRLVCVPQPQPSLQPLLRVNPAVTGRPQTRAAGLHNGLHGGLPGTGPGGMQGGMPLGRRTAAPPQGQQGPVTLTTQLGAVSRDGRVHLQIVCQPEQQHRARYQTEGSRGAVKDRTGNGFPVVKLIGYNKPTALQVFIGTDQGRVAPHMFYQACRVSGKNSTPCVEKKVDGTVVIEVDFEPSKEMTVTCDCVGILKERNVDVEHRFPDQTSSRSKKKSTRCRMVFRANIVNEDGVSEVLQVTSHPIVCTQPPGVPEICKKSLTSSPCTGGMELFIIGKNFLKDTRVVFQKDDEEPRWEEAVLPDKEFLQQTHLVCTVPPFRGGANLSETVSVRLLVESGGKASEAHSFIYTPATMPATPAMQVAPTDVAKCCTATVETGIQPVIDLNRGFPGSALLVPGPAGATTLQPTLPPGAPSLLPFPPVNPQHGSSTLKDEVHPVMMWPPAPLLKEEKAKDLMPPPASLAPPRRPSLILPEPLPALKTEVLDEPMLTTIGAPVAPSPVVPSLPSVLPAVVPSSTVSSGSSTEALHGVDLRMNSMKSPSMATIQQFMRPDSSGCLPTQSGHSVETYLNGLESDKILLEHHHQHQQQQQQQQQVASAQQQQQSPSQPPLDPRKSPEQAMVMPMPVLDTVPASQPETFLSQPRSLPSQMDNILMYPPTTQEMFVTRSSAPHDPASFINTSCNASIAQKSILNSGSPPRFPPKPSFHDECSNHAPDLRSSPPQQFSPMAAQLVNVLHDNQTTHRTQHLVHILQDDTSNQAPLSQIPYDEASSHMLQEDRSNHALDVKVQPSQHVVQLLHDERSNHALEGKTANAQQFVEVLQESHSNHALDTKTSTAQQFVGVLQDRQSNLTLEAKASPEQRFSQMLSDAQNNHSIDVKTSAAAQYSQLLCDDRSNHASEVKAAAVQQYAVEGKPTTAQDIAQMIARDERSNQQLASILQEDRSNHALEVKTATSQFSHLLQDEASNRAILMQHDNLNKSTTHLSFTHLLRGDHSSMEMAPEQRGYVSVLQGDNSHRPELKPYCDTTSTAQLLGLTDTRVPTLQAGSFVITQAPSTEVHVSCITSSNSLTSEKDQTQVISPAYSAPKPGEQGHMQPQGQVPAQTHQVQFATETTTASNVEYPILSETLASGKLFTTDLHQPQLHHQQQQTSQTVSSVSKAHSEFQDILNIFGSQ